MILALEVITFMSYLQNFLGLVNGILGATKSK